MKTPASLLATLSLFVWAAGPSVQAQHLKPYILAHDPGTTDLVQAVATVKTALQAQGFEIAGTYQPYPGASVVVVTSAELKAAAARTAFGGYGAVQRIALTQTPGGLQVAYTNPTYYAAAYRLQGNLDSVKTKLDQALGRRQDFGSKNGLLFKKLHAYHYALGMERFDSLAKHLLAEFPTHAAAVAAVEAGLAAGRGGTAKVYRVDLPGKEEVVFGVALREGKGADAYVMERIDFAELKHTAHLPYEMLVSGSKVYHLFARFRIAIDFPDLSMMGQKSFLSIMSAPGAIQDALTEVVTAKPAAP